MPETGKVLAAVDGSADSGRAVAWALAEARSRRMPLVLVHVVPHLLRQDNVPPVAEQRARVDRVLQAARQQAARAPVVETDFRRSEPLGLEVGPALASAAAPGDTLVVGAHGHRRVARLVLGSASRYVARHTPATVVVVRTPADESASRTIVGFDRSPAAQRALDWAISRAADHGGDVVALRAWHRPTLHDAGKVFPLPVDATSPQQHEQALLETELGPWREKHPEVRLLGEAVPGHAAHLLSTASRHAALVVVGSRRTGPVATLLGSVAQAVLHHAHCPVAVVR